MPTENTTTVTAPDSRDAEIKKLKQDLENLGKENTALAQDLAEAKKQLKAKPAAAAAAPAGDYCVLGGKTYRVAGTIATRFASDHGRKNNTEDEELVILKR